MLPTCGLAVLLMTLCLKTSLATSSCCLSEEEGEMLKSVQNTLKELEKALKGKNQQVSCDEGWEEYQGHCYSFQKDKKNWEDAESACKEANGYLAKLDTLEENNWVRAKAKEMSMRLPWIGMRKINGVWQWSVDSSTPNPFRWGKGQPDYDGNCVDLHSWSNYDWNNYWCRSQEQYICEQNKKASCGPPA